MVYHYFYKTINLINNKFYYGIHSTSNLDDGYIGSGKKLWLSIQKYGIENFSKEIIEFFPNRTLLLSKEREIVNEELLSNLLCMNLKIGGEGGSVKGVKRSEETRSKLSKNWKPRKFSDIAIQAMRTSMLGKTHTEDTKLKMSESRKGKKLPPFTDEHKRNLSIKRKMRVITQESKDKMVKSQRKRVAEGRNIGWKLSEDSRQKQKNSVSAALKGKPKEKVECPHCSKIGGRAAMMRFHFDKCKGKL